MAALTAALMSTVDTLVTAVSAIVVNDIYQPKHPDASEKKLLSVARMSALGVTGFGVALVPLFASFDSIYAAHGAFTAAVTPPLVVTLLLGVFWRGFPPRVAVWTMVGGCAVIAFSLFVPDVIAPFAHGVSPGETGDGFMDGFKTFKFMRAFFGIVVCLAIAFILTPSPRPLVVPGVPSRNRHLRRNRVRDWFCSGRIAHVHVRSPSVSVRRTKDKRCVWNHSYR